MVTVARLIEMLQKLPADARCIAYDGTQTEGPDVEEIHVRSADGQRTWVIKARGAYSSAAAAVEDDQSEFEQDLQSSG